MHSKEPGSGEYSDHSDDDNGKKEEAAKYEDEVETYEEEEELEYYLGHLRGCVNETTVECYTCVASNEVVKLKEDDLVEKEEDLSSTIVNNMTKQVNMRGVSFLVLHETFFSLFGNNFSLECFKSTTSSSSQIFSWRSALVKRKKCGTFMWSSSLVGVGQSLLSLSDPKKEKNFVFTFCGGFMVPFVEKKYSSTYIIIGQYHFSGGRKIKCEKKWMSPIKLSVVSKVLPGPTYSDLEYSRGNLAMNRYKTAKDLFFEDLNCFLSGKMPIYLKNDQSSELHVIFFLFEIFETCQPLPVGGETAGNNGSDLGETSYKKDEIINK